MPLELGGSNSRANLWRERAPGFERKDAVENAYHDAVCSGTLKLAVGQHRMARSWLQYAPKDSRLPTRAQRRFRPMPRPSSPGPSGHVRCSDFSSHAQAQAYFEGHRGNAGNLDGDGDGQACESLR